MPFDLNNPIVSANITFERFKDKFEALPIDADTQILLQLNAKLDDYDVLYQMWNWDGIAAESFIYFSADIATLTDDEVKTLSKSSPIIKEESEITKTRDAEGYALVNFNFKE